jgi:hypothetical protein
MAYAVGISTVTRTSAGAIDVNTSEYHPFQIGDKVRLHNVMGGGIYPFMSGNPYTVVTITNSGTARDGTIISRSFQLNQAGAPLAGTASGTVTISAISQYGNSTGVLQVTTSSAHGFIAQPKVSVKGVTTAAGSTVNDRSAMLNAINSNFDGSDVAVLDTTNLLITVRAQAIWQNSLQALDVTNAKLSVPLSAMTVALDDGINTSGGYIGGVGITNDITKRLKVATEGKILSALLDLAWQSKGTDYAFLRLFDLFDKSRLTTSYAKTNLAINTSASTLRSVLDTLIESYSAFDQKKRRYYVNQDGQLVYELLSDVTPAQANAPYKIITSGAGSPNNTTTPATIAPYSLELSWDHDTTKRALFRGGNPSGAPILDLIKADSPDALGTAYTRSGAPYFDDSVDYPSGADGKLTTRQAAAKAYFLERYAPVLSGSFTLRGAGTASYNNLGFASGYATISSTITTNLDAALIQRSGTTVISVSTKPYIHHYAVGMTVVLNNVQSADYAGTYTIASIPSGTSFTVTAAARPTGVAVTNGDAFITATGAFIRTGTAPNQIVTVSLPAAHGLTTGTTTVVTGLTGTAGTSMNGTATITRVDDYSFTYPSTGTNGTATGTPVLTSMQLIPRWEPGQWVDIAAPELGLSGLYRIEQIDWGLEPGSFQQIITVMFNRRPTKTLTKLLQGSA